jgi:hypothetical protein
MQSIKIPKRFYDDHIGRDLEAPRVVRETQRHYFIEAKSQHMDELMDDAWYHATQVDDCGGFVGGVVKSADATVNALLAAGVSKPIAV